MKHSNAQYAPWSEDEDDPMGAYMTPEESKAAARKVAESLARDKEKPAAAHKPKS